MAELTLLLDEDVRVLLADILRQRGYDAVHVLEVGRGGKSDPEQLAYAVGFLKFTYRVSASAS
jgi:predicted nuclease of predicted toxin-antitoxin system